MIRHFSKIVNDNKSLINFVKKAPSSMFGWVLNMLLYYNPVFRIFSTILYIICNLDIHCDLCCFFARSLLLLKKMYYIYMIWHTVKLRIVYITKTSTKIYQIVELMFLCIFFPTTFRLVSVCPQFTIKVLEQVVKYVKSQR